MYRLIHLFDWTNKWLCWPCVLDFVPWISLLFDQDDLVENASFLDSQSTLAVIPSLFYAGRLGSGIPPNNITEKSIIFQMN